MHHYGTPEEQAKVEAAVYAEYPEMRARRHGDQVVVSDTSGKHGATVRHGRRRVGMKVYRKAEA